MPQLTQLFIRKEGGRAPTYVKLTDNLPATTVLQVQIHLALQIAHVGDSTLMVLGNNLVAGAVVTQGFTKRNVHVERHWLFCRSCHFALLQRQDIVIITKCLHKPVSSGVRGIAWARHVIASQEFGGDYSHESFFLVAPTLQQLATFILDLNQGGDVKAMPQFDSHHS